MTYKIKYFKNGLLVRRLTLNRDIADIEAFARKELEQYGADRALIYDTSDRETVVQLPAKPCQGHA